MGQTRGGDTRRLRCVPVTTSGELEVLLATSAGTEHECPQ